MKPVPPAVRAVVSDRGYAPGLPYHPESYAVTEPGEVRPWPPRRPRRSARAASCACAGRTPWSPCTTRAVSASARCRCTVRSCWSRRTRCRCPGATAARGPPRHRSRCGSTRALGARRERRPGAVPPYRPYRRARSSTGSARPWPPTATQPGWWPGEAPLALLAQTPTEELAWGVRECGAVGLDGAVEFFASESFTSRHPKKRRVGATARDLLLRHRPQPAARTAGRPGAPGPAGAGGPDHSVSGPSAATP